jgi:hypothetical protein
MILRRPKRLPNFLLSWPWPEQAPPGLAKNLMLHPQVFLPRRKSTRFFLDNYHRGTGWYESHFKGRKEAAVGEASVGYFAHPESAKLIKKHLPNVKMIATLRDPVDRAYSHMNLLRGLVKKGDPLLTMDFEEKLRITPQMVYAGKYATHLEHYYSLFPRENILVMFYHEMKEAPHEFLRKIYTFLEVDPSFRSPLLDQRINSTATRLADSNVKKAIYRVLLRLDLFKLSNRIDSSMQKSIPPLSDEVRERLLHTQYLDEIERLESMLRVNLDRWKSVGADRKSPE